jgi:hypothetical protein
MLGQQSIMFSRDMASILPTMTSRWSMIDHIFLKKPSYAQNREDIVTPSSASSSVLAYFVSPPLRQREITGEITLQLYFSANAANVTLFAYVEDVNNVPAVHSMMMMQQRQQNMIKVRGGVTYMSEAVRKRRRRRRMPAC